MYVCMYVRTCCHNTVLRLTIDSGLLVAHWPEKVSYRKSRSDRYLGLLEHF